MPTGFEKYTIVALSITTCPYLETKARIGKLTQRLPVRRLNHTLQNATAEHRLALNVCFRECQPSLSDYRVASENIPFVSVKLISIELIAEQYR